ncbi:putative quinol monooxygenase [Novosphingobium sp. 9]|uniref:putative quinol monooxygenase n=1 Tax=Novosphingobium sp. 9 TaxID=2025349 RepID=UPI0021B5E698|nr:putative quinol monooxygenase [Novosphingobium sp. 9]
MSTEISVVAIAEAKPGTATAVEAVIRPCIGETRKEPGCLLYNVHRDQDFPDRFVFIERWTDTGALDVHKTTPHFLAMVDGLEPHLDAPLSILVLNPLD